MSNNKIQFDITWSTLWKVFIFVGLILILYLSRYAFGMLFAGIVISLGLDPIVDYFERRGVHRVLGALLTFIVLISLFVATIWFIIPVIISEIGSFFSQINNAIEQLLGLELFTESAIEDITTNLVEAASILTSPGVITGAVSAVFSNLILVVSTVVISFYLLIEKNGTERMIRIVLPRSHEEPVLSVFSRFKEKIRVWLAAQLAISVIVGTLVGLGLLILNWILPIQIRYILLIALLAALFEIVPIVGPILSGAIAFLVTVPTDFTLGLFVLGLFFIVQQIESNVLTPTIMRKAMRIHPILVLVALIAGGHTAGFIGILLAVPVALLAQEIFNYVAEHRNHAPENLGI